MFFTKTVGPHTWAVCYEKAIREDGSLFFPEVLSKEFLDQQRREQGSYIFANQYQNEIIPSGDQEFKREWLTYYDQLPERKLTFAFLDPAISLEDQACYSAFVVVDVDTQGDWYVRVAKRVRIDATQTIDLLFKLYDLFKPQMIGVEVVAYQQSIMHFLNQEMRRRKKIIPVTGLKVGTDKSKHDRIRALIPRFEWQRIKIKRDLNDFEEEYLKFPRGTYVDILDALSSLEEIAHPAAQERKMENEPGPNSPNYEKHYIKRLLAQKAREAREDSGN